MADPVVLHCPATHDLVLLPPRPVAVLLFVARWRLRQDRTSFTARVLATVALFSVGLLPQAIQRVDSAHFAWVSCVPIAFLPIAHRRGAAGEGAAPPGPGAQRARRRVVLVFLLRRSSVLHRSHATPTSRSRASASTGSRTRSSTEGRTFYYGRPEAARAANELLPVADRISKPGDRLFVGPDRSSQDAVQRRLPLLHAARPGAGDVLHRDGPRRGQRRRLAVWPTTSAPPTSRSSRRSGTTGTSRTTPASSDRTGPTRS